MTKPDTTMKGWCCEAMDDVLGVTMVCLFVSALVCGMAGDLIFDRGMPRLLAWLNRVEMACLVGMVLAFWAVMARCQ